MFGVRCTQVVNGVGGGGGDDHYCRQNEYKVKNKSWPCVSLRHYRKSRTYVM